MTQRYATHFLMDKTGMALKRRSLAWVLCIALLLYPMSIGPVAALYARHRAFVRHIWQRGYWPLHKLSRCEPFRDRLISYIQLWLPDDQLAMHCLEPDGVEVFDAPPIYCQEF